MGEAELQCRGSVQVCFEDCLIGDDVTPPGADFIDPFGAREIKRPRHRRLLKERSGECSSCSITSGHETTRLINETVVN